MVYRFKESIRKIQNFIYWHYINGSAYNTPFWKKASKYKIKDNEFHSILNHVKKTPAIELRDERIERHKDIYGHWLPISFKLWHEGIK